jgi:hypothetical protein
MDRLETALRAVVVGLIILAILYIGLMYLEAHSRVGSGGLSVLLRPPFPSETR